MSRTGTALTVLILIAVCLGGLLIYMQVTPVNIPVQIQVFDARQSVVPIVMPGNGAGSGCVIAQTDQYWYIGTARHVIENQMKLVVGQQVAELVASDDKYDIAILRVPRTGQDYCVLVMGEIRLNQTVRSYGYHWQNGIFAPELMVMTGRVSCMNFDGFYTANGGLFPGNSGGPLLSESGKLLGIASRIPNVWGSPHYIMACFVPARHLQELLTANLEGVQ